MSNCGYSTSFKGVDNISQDLLLNIVESNLKTYLDWSFLKIGGWIDVQKPKGGIFNENKHYQLLSVNDPSYPEGMVWQGIRKDWVWETDISYNSISPIPITSLLINNSTIPRSSFIVNHPLGRVILESPIVTSSVVEMNYSYRFVQVHRSCDSPWFNLVQYNSFHTDSPDITRINDGEWSIGANHRIQLPAIIIEALPRSRSRPYEIGNKLLLIEQDIAFYVLAENKNDRNKILDIIRLQQDTTLQLYDTNLLAQNEKYPLDHNGDIKNTPLMYPNMVDQYPWRTCLMKNINLFELESPHVNFHQGMARATVEIISG
jgi:hypothetical protein